MKKKTKLYIIGASLVAAFVLWTVLVLTVNVGAVGPNSSEVGFSALNSAFHDLTGVHMSLYVITDWLGLVPLAAAAAFAVFGLVQWIKRRSIAKVDKSILALGAFYVAVIAVYVLFELWVVNRRPVLIEGHLEASYPSSTTMTVMCIMPTAAMQLSERIKGTLPRRIVTAAIYAFSLFMVIGRLISGVHWLTDIIGGALISAGLVTLYAAFGHKSATADLSE